MGYEIRRICTYIKTWKNSDIFPKTKSICLYCRDNRSGSDHCSNYYNTSRDNFEIKVTLSRDLCRGECCSDHCRVFIISLHLRTRLMDSILLSRQLYKQINFVLGKIEYI